ncbi:polyprenol monophosphomannose synthase [Dermabacteraceae bacterium TAE3-ERU27]|nr:polyprenol monophosphomannose synthase [Dermabacteraceae bacterium TAE3-ERU27]
MSETPVTAPAARITVVIPTYNEARNLPRMIAGVREACPEAQILVVDDASPDGTGKLAEQIAAADDAVQVLHRQAKEGLGPAYLAGFARALQGGADTVVQMDADLSHRPCQLPRLLEGLAGGADLVLGSRWIPGGAVHDWALHRRLLSRFANLYAAFLLRLPVRDATSGFRAWRAGALSGLPLVEVASAGYCFQVDMVSRAVRAGQRVSEVPIDFDERRAGCSKMSPQIVGEALLRVTLWGIKGLFHRAAA